MTLIERMERLCRDAGLEVLATAHDHRTAVCNCGRMGATYQDHPAAPRPTVNVCLSTDPSETVTDALIQSRIENAKAALRRAENEEFPP